MSDDHRQSRVALPSSRVLAITVVVLLGASIWVGSYWDGHCSEHTTGSTCTATGYGIIVASCVLFALAAAAGIVITARLVRRVHRRR